MFTDTKVGTAGNTVRNNQDELNTNALRTGDYLVEQQG